MDKQLLNMLVCPKCKGDVAIAEDGKDLHCDRCQFKYPVRNDIPYMLVEEAVDMRTGISAFESSFDKLPRVNFRVLDGPDQNLTFELDTGTCRAIGRATADPKKTSVFNVDIALELDETTRRLVQQYVSRQFRKESKVDASAKGKIGSFRRMPDIVLTDASLSRLHAMLFYDRVGIGILDLVSKNGTYVNGKEIESKLLSPGDTIEMGDTTITFEG